MKIRYWLLLAAFTAAFAGAQTAPTRDRGVRKEPPASAHKLTGISVKGNQRFASADVIAASGLKIGSTVTEDDFKRAAELLGDTGAFTDVAYSYSYSPEGTKVELQVAESEKLVPAVFENFVWDQGAELVNKIHHYVPLFNGELPVSGNLPDQVADALQALVVQHGSKAHVDYLRSGPDDKPIDAIIFSITGIEILVRKVDCPGATAAEEPLLASAAGKLMGKEYTESKISAFAKRDLLPVYLRRGFLKASFGSPRAKIVQEGVEELQVDVALPVTPGPQYTVAGITWIGNKALQTDKFNALFHNSAGQAANAIQLKSDLDGVQTLYKNHGYMAAEITPIPRFDDVAHTVSYELKVREGDLYHMGDVEFHGLDSRTTDRMRLAWALHEGDPYDASYPHRFLREINNFISPDVNWDISVHESVNPTEKTVDVELRFAVQGAS